MSRQHYARIAEIYDSFVQTEADVPFFLNEARKAGGNVLELMAGTGRLSIPLIQAGIPLSCLDYSPEMLDILRGKLADRGLSATIYEGDVRSFDLSRTFQQIIIPFQSFPELTAESDQLETLRRIHTHLAEDGSFICTLHNPPVRVKAVDNQMHLAGRFPLDQNQLFVWLLQKHNPETKVVEVLEFFEEYDPQGVLCLKRFSEVRFHLLEKATFEKLIAAAGFEVVHLYGNYAYAPFEENISPFMIWVLRKG